MRWEAQSNRAAFLLALASLPVLACSSTSPVSENRHVDVTGSGGTGGGDAGGSGGSPETGGASASGGTPGRGGAGGAGGVLGTGGFLDPSKPEPDAGAQVCKGCLIQLSTTQSNAFHAIAKSPLVVTAKLADSTVFGLGSAGKGRLVFSGDGNIVFREGQCPLWQWLGATGAAYPRVLCIGAKYPCLGETHPGAQDVNGLHGYPGQLDYGGLTLPPRYDGSPAALRDDYDVVTYFGVLDHATGTWRSNPADAGTLETFVREEGGGLYIVSEYYGGGASDAQIASANELGRPWSVEFERLSLAWAQTSAEATLQCLPKDPREGELR
jgi:hypothetical protein